MLILTAVLNNNGRHRPQPLSTRMRLLAQTWPDRQTTESFIKNYQPFAQLSLTILWPRMKRKLQLRSIGDPRNILQHSQSEKIVNRHSESSTNWNKLGSRFRNWVRGSAKHSTAQV